MNQDIFQKIPLIKKSFLQKIFNQLPKDNALIELNNILATRNILEITSNQIRDLELKYNVSLSKEYSLNLQEFYTVYLNYCLNDKTLSDEEIQILSHLKLILALSDKAIQKLHSKLGEIIYRESFTEVIKDGNISASEKKFLSKLENDLKLPEELVTKISLEQKTKFVEDYLIDISSDKRISPEEEQELKKLAKNLGVNLNQDEKSNIKLKKLKQYWAIENLPLNIIEADIEIQKSENCYLKLPFSNWYEQRARQKNNFVSYSVNKDLINFHLDSQAKTCNTRQLSLIEKGTLYLTNKRVIFIGQEKNYNIKFEKILNVIPYSDGIEIIKDGGKNPTIQVRENADILCLVLHRIINENR